MDMDMSQLIAGLSDPHLDRRRQAAEELARRGEDARAAAVPLVRVVADPDEQVCEWATAALEELGPPAADEVEPLAALLSDENADVGYWAATLLGRLHDQAAAALPALTAALSRSPHLIVRQRAAWALGEIGPRTSEAREALRRATADPDPRLSRLATRALQAAE